MKRIILMLLCLMSLQQVMAQTETAGKSTDSPLRIWPDSGCIWPDGTLHLYYSDNMHTDWGDDIYAWVFAQGWGNPWPVWHGPYPPIAPPTQISSTLWEYVYQLNNTYLTIDPTECYKVFWSPYTTGNPTGDMATVYMRVFCPCEVPCNANFCYDVCTQMPNVVTFMPQATNPLSTYHWDWGNGNTSSYPQSIMYAPGNYTICLTETQWNDTVVCRKCVDLCVNEGSRGGHHLPDGHGRKYNGINDPGALGIKNMMQVYPNPANGNTTVKLTIDKATGVSVSVLDEKGVVVSTVEKQQLGLGTHDIGLSTAGLASGTYIVQVVCDDRVITQKITVTR